MLDYIQRNRKHIAQAGQYPDIRRRSVIELAERCSYWPEHASQVARLSLSIFDQTRGVHALTDREREWLEFAALLHDIGTHISYPRHHKHSYYLIKNGDLRGFEPAEAEIIALDRAVSSQVGAEEIARRLRRARREEAPRPFARLPRFCGSPKRSIAATRRWSRAWRCTTAARNTSSSFARRATPSWSSGPPIVR